MKVLWQLAGLLTWLTAAGIAMAQAQDSAETRAFNVAARTFQYGIYDGAEREFAAFVQQYPNSPRVPEARLFQARSALRQHKLIEAIDQLNAHAGQSGQWADEYRYWLAQAHLEGGNSLAAAETFSTLARDFPNSARLLEAGYGEALARYRRKEWRRVSQLLQDTNGTFARAVRLRSNDELAVRGNLLLGEALLELREYGQAEKAAGALAEKDLIPEFKWRRQYLLCRIQMTAQRPREALEGTTNLLSLATASGQVALLAESIAMQGDVLKQLGEFAAAASVYEKNLQETAPPERRRRALLSIIELALAQNRPGEATLKLETFLEKHPEDAASDVALLTLGELHLRQYLIASSSTNRTNAVEITGAPVASPPVTNHLQLAQGQFDRLLKTYTNSPLTGKAWLKLGWCLWEDGRLAESATAFQLAVGQLPLGEDLAEAQFKLADAQFNLGEYTNAVRNYRLLLKEFDGVPQVRSTLFDHAIYQMVRASLELGDLEGANEALRRLLDRYPDSFYSDRSMLHVGQGYATSGKAPQAREIFSEFSKRFPSSPLLPEAELAVARSWAQEGNWPAAIAQYDSWLARFSTNSLRPKAEFNRAWAYAKADRATNAFAIFTNFVVQFPTNELAPLAQYWLGDYFFERQDFVNAQKTFQVIFENTNWPPSTLSYQARIMAGHAAYRRQDWNGAVGERGHFTVLTKEGTDCPPELVAEAFFAFGDTKIAQEPDPADPLAKYDGAKVAFRKIPDLFPTSHLVPRAWGRIGDCYFQMASADPKYYVDAADSYQKALTATNADVVTRYQAQYGLGQVLERQARLSPDNAALIKSAFDRYFDLISGKLLREGERPDPIWLKRAGLAAAELEEGRKHWDVAANIYRRLKEALPPIAPALDRKIEKVLEQARTEKN